jgi:tellurite resistance-related uncharacterized protein
VSKHSITYFVEFSSHHDVDRWLIRIHDIAVPDANGVNGRHAPATFRGGQVQPSSWQGVLHQGQNPKGSPQRAYDKIWNLGGHQCIEGTVGQLRYQINEPSVSVHILDSENKGIIEPQVKHEVAPLTDDVEFVVEFYRLPGTGPVIETREGLNE